MRHTGYLALIAVIKIHFRKKNNAIDVRFEKQEKKITLSDLKRVISVKIVYKQK